MRRASQIGSNRARTDAELLCISYIKVSGLRSTVYGPWSSVPCQVLDSCFSTRSARPFQEGDVVRFAEGDMHGFKNTGAVEFIYMSVTSPPINFRRAYEQSWPRTA